MHNRLVSVGQKTKGAITICCAHEDKVIYPVTELEITVSSCMFMVEAGVSRTLPASVLLGTDVSELMMLLLEIQEETVETGEPKTVFHVHLAIN